MGYNYWCEYCGFDYKNTAMRCDNPNCPSKNITITNYTKPEEEAEAFKNYFIVHILNNYDYYINNPSAWKNFSQEGSDLIEQLVSQIRSILCTNTNIDLDFDVLDSL